MPYFGLQTVKLLAVICAGISGLIALSLIVNGSVNRKIWYVTSPVLGGRYWRGFDFAIGIGVSIILVLSFGCAGIVLNGYGMLVIYLVLLSTIMVINIIGVVYFMLVPWTASLRQLDLTARQLTPEQLSAIEKNFRCCGVEKYTDYFMIWKIFTSTKTDVPDKGELNKVFTGSSVQYTKTTKDTSWWGKKKLKNMHKYRKNLEEIKKAWKLNLTNDHPDFGVLKKKKKITHLSYQRRHLLPSTARFRYEPDSIYSLFKKYLYGLFGDTIRKYFATKKGQEVQESWFEWLYGKFKYYYKRFIPEFIRDIILGFLGTFLWWTQIFWRPFWNRFKWWRGSGWDDLFWKYVQPKNGPLLPYTCCKVPQVECRGSPFTTWEEGCVYMTQVRWQVDTNRLVAAFGTYLIASFVNIGVILVLIGGIRQKYYY